jgi:FixJ family two-component response regulator
MSDPVHIALIDDDPAVLDSLRMYFERQTLQTSCFDAPEDFLATVDRSAQFDCVVSDVRMPGVSGLDLVRHLKTRRFTRPIILITGHGDIDMAKLEHSISSKSRSKKLVFSPAFAMLWSRNASM